MTPEEQRIAIAEACGWTPCNDGYDTWMAPGSRLKPEGGIEGYWCHVNLLPDYCNDLNAMHEAEKTLPENELRNYFRCLEVVVDRDSGGKIIAFAVGRATAAQRAEAFLRTIGKWKD